jgi:proteasome activator subunit 4
MTSNLFNAPAPDPDITRSSTPAANWRGTNSPSNAVANRQNADNNARSRPRTYPYFEYLPYETEDEKEALRNLNICLKNLYISVKSGAFAPGVVHWTRELRGWLSLKFDMPRDVRISLVHLYYGLSLAPGLDNTLCERFASMFMFLTK